MDKITLRLVFVVLAVISFAYAVVVDYGWANVLNHGHYAGAIALGLMFYAASKVAHLFGK